MIPKIIHYCWFGKGEKSKTIKKCMKSWKKKCPDYQIIEWNEDSFNIKSHKFVYDAYCNNNWAFVSDYVRLYALNIYGGIYLDTDVEIIKKIDSLLSNTIFMGFEDGLHVANGLIFGSVPNHPFIQELMCDYDKLRYVADSVDFRIKNTNTERTTNLLLAKGLKQNNQLQYLGDITIYPKEFFCPLDVNTLIMKKTKKTYTIHWYEGAWTSDKYKEWKRKQIKKNKIDKIRFFPQRTIRKILGDSRVENIKRKMRI